MQDFVESAKRAASQAAEYAAWMADRQRRTSARQHELELARRERNALLEQMAGVVLDLERRGQLTQEALVALARRLAALDQEIGSGAADVQAIRAETFKPGSMPPSSAAPAPPAPQVAPPQLDHACARCGQQVKGGAAFCSSCGARQR